MAITPANFKIAIPITALNLTGPTFRRVSTQLGAVAARWGKLGLLGAGTALAATGVAAIRAGASFEDSFERAKFMTKATADEVEALEKTIQDVAFATPFSPREIALGVKELGQAGLAAKQAMGAIRPVADFAIAAEQSLAEASDTLLSAVKALELPMANQVELMQSMGHVSDVMTRAMVSSQTTIPQLGEAYASVLPILKKTKQEYVTTTAALSALADVQFKGEEGGTALKNILLRLGNPSNEAREAMKALGVETSKVYDEFGNLRSLPTVLDAFNESGRLTQVLGRIAEIEKLGGDSSYLENVAQAMQEIGETGPQFQHIAEIFQQRATAPFFALLDAQKSGKLKKLSDIFNDPESAKALDLTERIMSTSQGAILRMQASWSQMLISLGKTGFLDATARWFEVGTTFLAELAKALPKNERFAALMQNSMRWATAVKGGLESSQPVINKIAETAARYMEILQKGAATAFMFMLDSAIFVGETVRPLMLDAFSRLDSILSGIELVTTIPRYGAKAVRGVSNYASDMLTVAGQIARGERVSLKDRAERERDPGDDIWGDMLEVLKQVRGGIEALREDRPRRSMRDFRSAGNHWANLRSSSVHPALRYS